jgi:Asp-tRNA(Asn)/Glu-tRNA(Gln) amidotransferase A subunit family amidase
MPDSVIFADYQLLAGDAANGRPSLAQRHDATQLDTRHARSDGANRCRLAILLDVIVGPDPDDPATGRAEGHRPPTYTTALRADALKGARLGVLRQVFGPAVTDPRIITQFEETIDELKSAGAEIVDPFTVMRRATQCELQGAISLLRLGA